MQLGFVDFQNFVQGFDFASREAICEAMGFQNIQQVGFHQGCDTAMV